jgi:hypothetical protein
MELSGQPHVPNASPQRKDFPIPFDYKAGWGPKKLVWMFLRENSLGTAGIRTPVRTARSLVTMLSTLSRHPYIYIYI